MDRQSCLAGILVLRVINDCRNALAQYELGVQFFRKAIVKELLRSLSGHREYCAPDVMQGLQRGGTWQLTGRGEAYLLCLSAW